MTMIRLVTNAGHRQENEPQVLFLFCSPNWPLWQWWGLQWRELMAVLLDNPARSSSLTACASTAWREKVELMMIWRSSRANQTKSNWRRHLSHVTEHILVISIFISFRPGWFVFVILYWVQRWLQFRIQFLYRFWFHFDSIPWLAFRSASIQSTNWQNQVPTLLFFSLFNNQFHSKVHHNKEGKICCYFQYIATWMVTLTIILVIE